MDLVGLLLPFVIGLPFTIRLASWGTRLAIAFLAGVVIITVGLTVVGATGLAYSAATILPLVVIWFAAAVAALRPSWRRVGSASFRPPHLGWAPWLLLAITFVNVATAAAYGARVPISDWDVMKIWLPKSDLISSSGFTALAHSTFPDYPPLWPLHLYVARHFTTSVPWLKLVPTLYLASTLALVFDYVRSRVGPAVSAACVLVISGVPYIWMPYGVNDLMSDVPMMAFATAGTILLAEYVNRPSRSVLALTATMEIGAILVRPEGFFHAVIVGSIVLVVGIRGHRIREVSIAIASLAAAYLGWQAVVHFVFHFGGGLKPNLSALGLGSDLSSVAQIIRYAATNLGNPYLFGPALIAAICVVLGLQNWRLFWVVALVFLFDVAASVAIYTALPSTYVGQPLIWWLTTGFKRLLMHAIPLLYIAAALSVGGLLRHKAAGETSVGTHPRRLWFGLARAPLSVALVGAIIGLLVTGYAVFQVGGPKSYDLSDMGPTHVSDTTPGYPAAGLMSMTLDGGADPQVEFYLQNTGRRLPPLDNISGVFGVFSARVEAVGSAPIRVSASVDGNVIGEVTVAPGSGPVVLSGEVPIGGRFLVLSAHQLGPGSDTVMWVSPTLSRLTLWWATEALLAAALAMAVISALGGLGARGAITPGLISIPLLGAAAIQQAEALWEVAVPVWAYALGLVFGHL